MPAPINFTWDINPVALLALVGGAVTVIAFWLRSSDVALRANQLAETVATEVREARRVADAAERKAAVAQEAAERTAQSLEILKAALSAYRETQAERLVSREILREVEDRLASSIERMGDRLDSLLRELLVKRGPTQQTQQPLMPPEPGARMDLQKQQFQTLGP